MAKLQERCVKFNSKLLVNNTGENLFMDSSFSKLAGYPADSSANSLKEYPVT
ncbi:MAG TPA: hypothetical protein H9808_02835 [Candidatus Atopostipes pullistercoris]|uniref:Uncharacterized protein n=2 Tax=Carnobacteriaceae TaxID=186828 RepID=A0A9D2JXX0_9LACT|nr:hypothetical protein [Candidatus Atopostipes pullistercoris]HJA89647.1 hypothetical protein [Candidatus Jeotgalibaca merdavium]